jgi:hypothetical protein
MNDQQLTIRIAREQDAAALVRLAELDCAAPLTGRVLLAEVDLQPLAAVGLESGAVVADPFRRSADAVRMLKLRRYQNVRQAGDVAPARSLLRRLVPAPAR